MGQWKAEDLEADFDQGVDVFVFDLLDGVFSEDDFALLSLDERQRALKYLTASDRGRFVQGRAGLRRLLSRYSGENPATIRFAYGPRGKPFLAGTPMVRFNLSHSEDKVAVVISMNREVGIDIENSRRDRDYVRFAERLFTREEREWLLAQPQERLRASFYRAWTSKEAYFKALGTGLDFEPARSAMRFNNDDTASLLTRDRTCEWKISSSSAVAGYLMSVCARSAPAH